MNDAPRNPPADMPSTTQRLSADFSAAEKASLNRMRWRSRRGLLELDLLFGPFFEEMYLVITPEQQQSFRDLLDQQDPDLLEWFSQRSRPEDPGMAALVDFMLARVRPAE